MVCAACGKIIDRPYGGMCQGCYHYFKKGGQVYPLPSPGTIQKDERGYIICHLCGRSYKRLGSHIRESHQSNIQEYKITFGLCKRSKTTEKDYSQKMRENALKNGMKERILNAGINTRIKKGDTFMRKGKSVCLQEIIDKRARTRKEGQNAR